MLNSRQVARRCWARSAGRAGTRRSLARAAAAFRAQQEQSSSAAAVTGQSELTIVGAGAAGLTAALFAAAQLPHAQVTVLERTREAGKKILMSGGTRCNVLPMAVDVGKDFSSAASLPKIVRSVLKTWSLPACRRWLEEDIGLELVDEEETSKVFPASHSSRDVRDSLVEACVRQGVEFRYNASVEGLQQLPDGGGWRCRLADGSEHRTQRLVLCAGGKSFPAVGTDGTGHRMLAELGVPLTPTFAALTPLVGKHPGGAQLAGLSLYNVKLSVSAPPPPPPPPSSGPAAKQPIKPVSSPRTGFLFTHKGFSGPSVLDVSQHLVVPLDQRAAERPTLRANWTSEGADVWEQRLRESAASGKTHVATVLQRGGIRERLADALCAELGLTSRPVAQLRREERACLVSLLTSYELQVEAHEGYKKAEVTGGGVSLAHVDPRTLEVQGQPGLHLAGELLDVTGRIGGFNFYWAWVSGRLAGLAAGQALASARILAAAMAARDSFVGLQTLSGVSLPGNPPATFSWRDFSATHKSGASHRDIFRADVPKATPWIAEQRLQMQAPDKFTNRVLNMTIVHTGGNTDMAHVTHHTVRATSNLSGTWYRGLQHDAAFDEEVYVSQEIADQMPAVLEECRKYHLHCADGWITTAGFVVCAHKAGLHLTRAHFLAIERAVPKDTLGRISIDHVTAAVERLVRGEPPARPPPTCSANTIRNATVIP